ncbi:TfoX/Sxy family protein [Algirhabdus cladophorae]|uniref:TfoX/Sxy family protein n=1 Tax=Algirhabdus cladophorae TaxID=3377108 RepID=UPI003B84842F
MAVTAEDIAFAKDLFADLGTISTRKMFGGLSIYCDGKIFAIIVEDQYRLKGAGDMIAVFEAEGWLRWTYTRKDGTASAMPYWDMPEALLDDPQEACTWARRALAHL